MNKSMDRKEMRALGIARRLMWLELGFQEVVEREIEPGNRKRLACGSSLTCGRTLGVFGSHRESLKVHEVRDKWEV